jgi:hypothetical protein
VVKLVKVDVVVPVVTVVVESGTTVDVCTGIERKDEQNGVALTILRIETTASTFLQSAEGRADRGPRFSSGEAVDTATNESAIRQKRIVRTIVNDYGQTWVHTGF